MELILYVLYFYITVYTIYFVVLTLRSIFDKSPRSERYLKNLKTNHLCLILYCHNNANALGTMLNQLDLQDYGDENFNTYVLIDSCNDTSENIVNSNPMIRKMVFDNPEPIGKDSAISILLEKIKPISSNDAYVFLDINRLIEPDFLSRVNSSLANNSIVTGATVFIAKNNSFINNIKSAYNNYLNNFIKKTRSVLGLAAIIDSDILVMNKSILDKIGNINFRTPLSELKYSLLLSNIKYPAKFSAEVKTYTEIKNYKFKKINFLNNFILFFQCFTKTFSLNFVFTEQVYALLLPNFWVLILSYLFLLKHSYKYYFIVDFSILLGGFVILLSAFFISLLTARLKKQDLFYLMFQPLYALIEIFGMLNPINLFKSQKAAKIERHSLFVTLSDGKREILCQLELISEDNLAKVVFSFKKKKFTTNNHLRMVEALQELILKLSEHGFALKICQCCKYFKPEVDGSKNMIKGICQSYISGNSVSNRFPTLLWNSCEYFNQKKTMNLIDELLD